MISLKALRDRLELNPADDDKLERIRADVIALWEARTNRLWNARADHVETFMPEELYERCSPIWLALTPVASIGKIEVWDDGNEANLTELAADDWKLLSDIGKITRLPQTTYWLRNVRVTYTGGYSSTTSPEDVRETLALQAQYILHRHKGERSVMSGVSGPSGNVQFMVSADVHPHFKAQAKLHRRHR